ncbi:MAG: oligosaccharide flippase family protein [Aequorivita sp.]
MFLYFRMLLVMAVSLYTSRIVLRELGVSDYGIYSLVGGFISLFGFLNAAMSSATQRYLTFDLGKNDPIRLGKTFSVSLTIHVGIALLVLVLAETVGLWYVNYRMIFPPERAFAVNFVYQFSVAAALLGIIQVPYNALIIAHERMGIYAYVSVVEVILKLVIVFLLVYVGNDKLITYSVLTFLVALGIRLFYQFYCRRHYKESHFKFEWDKPYYKELISFSGWSLFGNLAAIARGQGNNVLLNLFYGTTVNAAYGIALIVQGAISGFVQNFQVAVNPQLVKKYAQGDLKRTQSLIFHSAKFSFYLLLVLSIPVIINTQYILSLWLETVPQYSVNFVRLSLIYILIDSISYSLIIAIQATGKIKKYQIIIGTLIFMNLPISYVLLKLNYPPESVFIVLIIVTLLSLIFRMFFVQNLLKISPLAFTRQVVVPIIVVSSLIYGLCEISERILNIDLVVNSFPSLILSSLFYIGITLLIVGFIGIASKDRAIIINFIKSKIYGKD